MKTIEPHPLAGQLVLVTGGTGFAGQAVLRHLAADGARIRCSIRKTSDLSALRHLDVEWVTGDLADPGFVRELMRGVSYAIHMASTYRTPHATPREQVALHVTGTRNLARAAREQPGFKRFIHVSTIGVHGHIANPPADENYPFAAGDTYQQTKLQAEQWIFQYGREEGLPVVVVRPAAIYGPGDTRLFKLFRMATMPWVPLIGNGRGLYHLIHVDDLASFLLRCTTHPSAVGEVIICGNSSPIPIQDIIRTAGNFYGVHNRFIRLPVKPVKLAAWLCERACAPFRIPPPLHLRRVAFFTNDRAFDSSKMRDRMGFEPAWDNQSGILDTARWYAENGWIKRKG